MGWWFEARCPVEEDMQKWVAYRMAWLVTEFGDLAWQRTRTIEPTPAFFPDRYDGSEYAVQQMLERVCRFMGVDAQRVALQLYSEQEGVPPVLGAEMRTSGTAGLYGNSEREIIAIEARNLGDPMALVSTLAHELAHARLLGEGRVSGEEEDHEPLTDLATVFFGLGIFGANACVSDTQWTRGQFSGWSVKRQGYLPERAFAFALGAWAYMRGDDRPRWARHLRASPRALVKQTQKYLHTTPTWYRDQRAKLRLA